MPPITRPHLGTILSQVVSPRKNEFTPSPRARLTPHPPPRKAPPPPDPDPRLKVIDQLLTFYDSAKVRGRTSSFNITTLATITDVPWQAALDVVMALHTLDLCDFPQPPYSIVHIRPAHREALRFLEEEDYQRLAYLTEKAAHGQAPWQEDGAA